MAKQGGPSEIASVSVGVTADTTQLRTGMAVARAETQAAASSMAGSIDRSGKRMEASFGETARAARSFAAPLRALIGIAGTLITVGHAVAEAWQYVNTVFGDGKKKAEEFFNTISEGVGKQAEARLEAIRERIQDVQSELADSLENPYDPRGRSRKTIEGELNELRRRERSTSAQVRAAERSAKAAESEAAVREIMERNRLGLLDEALGVEREITKELDSQTERVQRRFEEVSALVNDLRSAGAADIANRLADANAKAFERAMTAIAKEMADEFRKVGREIADDMRTAMRDALRQIVPDIRAIGPKLDVINRSSNRLYGRGV